MNIEQQSFVQAANVATASETLANKPFGPLRADSNGNLFVRIGAGPLAGGTPVSTTARTPNADGVLVDDPVAIDAISYLYGFNGVSFDRVRVATPADAQANSAGNIVSASRLQGWNGGTWNRLRTADATNVALMSAVASLMTARPGQWAATSAPAAATQATTTRAAGGAGVRHLAQSIDASITTDAAYVGGAVSFILSLRDGAAGVGAVLWSKRIQATSAGPTSVSLSGLNVVGTANTAMTLEFNAGGAAASFQSVALTGSDTA